MTETNVKIEVSTNPEVYALRARRIDESGKEIGQQTFKLTVSTQKITADLGQYRELTPAMMASLGDILSKVSEEAEKILQELSLNS